MTATLDDEVADLRRANAELQRRLDEVVADRDEGEAQRAAIAEILEVINASPGDLAKVFDAILEKAHRLCGASKGSLVTLDGEHFRTVAMRGLSEQYAAILRDAGHNVPGSAPDRLLKGESLVHVVDARGSAFSVPRAAADLESVRTIAYVPLRKESALLGYITAYRQEVRPFTENQIALLQNFAAQAVIAMENARLLTETREALEQQTATSEVLGVINGSLGDLGPVFDAMLEKATRLCDASSGIFWTFDGEFSRAVAVRGIPESYAEYLREPVRLDPATGLGRVRQGEMVAVSVDLAAEEAYRAGNPQRRAFVDLGKARSAVRVPLIKDSRLLGIFTVYRQEMRPFTEKQIALLQNFAAQAVIGMENARLINETREALEQQTAAAEVLQVINSSPGDLAPIFDAMLEKAMRLCESSFGALRRFDGKVFWFLAVRDASGAIVEIPAEPILPDPGSASLRIVQGESMIHIPDLVDTEEYRARIVSRVIAVEKFGLRTAVWIALRKDDVLVGDFVVYRKEVRPFTKKQIGLLENFAAQAVIAMENARLITETREALEQQTATAEVLQVINSSPGDLAPVFDIMLEKAMQLCEAPAGYLLRHEDGVHSLAAGRGISQDLARFMAHMPQPHPQEAQIQILEGAPYVHVHDLRDSDAYRSGTALRRAAVDLGGLRTGLAVPLVKDGRVLGNFCLARYEVRPFTDKQIALLQNFAAQAVIAMENARLITETREALEQQTATAEVLQVINSSPGNLQPVFDAMLEKAMDLCGVGFGSLVTYREGRFHVGAVRGPREVEEWANSIGPIIPEPGSAMLRLIQGEDVAHVVDDANDDNYRLGGPVRKAMVEIGGYRTLLAIALRKDKALLGAIYMYRQELRPFTEKQIALLQNFAAQAVIAMENARLITETREALEQQTATAEVLQVINSSPGDLAPVFDAMLERATRLCEAEYGLLGTYGSEGFRGVAALGLPMGSADALSRIGHPPPGTTLGRVERTRETVQIVDIAQEPAYAEVFKVNPWLRQVHSNLVVPLLKDDELIGVFILFRGQVRPFTDKQIALVQNFAAQAVIAMENARLLNEIRQRQAELRVTFDNMVDGVAMFDEELRLAAWNRNFQQLLDVPDEFLAERHGFDTYIRYLTERGEFGETDPETQIRRLRDRLGDHYSFERTRPDGTVIEVRHNPMPDGGIVLIYSDITERKRSEAEIRAARDAAEAAYRDLKAAQASLVQAEKMASLGQLTAGIAHEIKNPLNFVNNFAGLSVELLDELKETAAPVITALNNEKRAEIDETIEMLTGNLEKIAEHGRRADNIVKSMLEHSRGSSGERRIVDLNGLIEEALNLAYHGGRAQDQSFNVTLERDYAQALPPIELVPQDITRVCLNLFGNGFYATTKRQREGGDPNFKPTLKVSTRDVGDAVDVRIRDNGTGIPPEIKDKLFQPFFTTKPTGEGTGLGLSISYDIVTQQHGGMISVDSRVGEFTEFTVRLPRRH